MKQMITTTLCTLALFFCTTVTWATSINITNISSFAESCLNAQDGYLIVPAECGSCTGALEYSTDNINFQSSNTFTDLAGGSYTVYVRDAANTSCATSQVASIQAGTVACDDCDNPSAAALAQLKIVASDAAANDNFGVSVSISGNYAIVGAYRDNGGRGSAYIFERNTSGTWNQAQKITASDATVNDFFGESVSISGNYAIVGAGSDDAGRGSAYIFERNMSGTWNQAQKITASDAAASDFFGFSVSISGNYAIIGAHTNDDDGDASGSAYIFEWNMSGTWNQVQKITASDASANDSFGYSVSISGNYAIVGAVFDDDSGSASGSAYIFERSMSGTWNQAQKITASDATASDQFGRSVSISGNYAIIGAFFNDDDGTNSGSSYIFERNMSDAWNQVQKITASDATADDRFGISVSISENRAIIGAYQDDDGDSNSGSTYVFERNMSGTWSQVQKITASDAAADDRFGESVSISGNYTIVGAYWNDDDGTDSGSAYINACTITLDNIIVTGESCAGANDGSISIAASGAIDLEYSIGNGMWQTNSSFIGLAVGTYTVKVRNANNPTCTAVCSTEIINEGLSITQIDGTDESCLNAQDGYFIVTAECGNCTGALEYSTDNTNFQSSNIFTDLAGGGYTIYVRDAANTSCSTSQVASLQASTDACDDCDNPSAAALAQLKLVASDATTDDRFGLHVSISDKYAIVGALFNDDDGTDSGSAYIFEQDISGAWNEVQKLTASDAALDDIFGSSVSISGDYAIIGAYRDDGYTGSVYVFERNMSGTWNEIQKLTASDAGSGDRFGVNVSLSGDYAIIGASTNDDAGSGSGSAYIFERNTSGIWNEVQKLTASDAAAADVFGRFVSISGGNAIVSAYQDDDDGNESGSAYIFERDMSGTWSEVQKLTASDAAADDRFGFSVSIAGEEAVVGAYQDDDGGNESGSAYVFKRDMSGTWNQVQKLTASDAAANDFFGYSVSITECNIAVGAYQDDDGSSNSGSAYIFERDMSGTWTEIQKLNASDAAADDRFGVSIVLSGDNAIIGADLNDDGGRGSGSAYIQDISCFIVLDDIIAVNESCGGADDGSITITASGASDMEYSIENGIWQSSNSFTGLDEGTYTVKVRNANKPTCMAVCTAVLATVPACIISISPKVYLQGPLVGSVMADQLRINALLPTTEPYTALGYTYIGGGGGETAAASVFTVTGGMAVIDWVIVELRDDITPTTIVESRAALLLSDGNVVEVDGVSPVTLNSPSGTYHVAIRHRNHLGVMTNAAIFLD